MKVNKILNFLFVFTIIGEAILLVIFPLNFINLYSDDLAIPIDLIDILFPLWFILPFILLTGLTAAHHKTIIRTIIFIIVNLSPIMIMVCNILFEKDKEYIKKYKMCVIILGIFQVIYLILSIVLFKIKSWKWISNPINQFDDKLKKVHIIHQFENALFLMTVSFLGMWIFLTDSFHVGFYHLFYLTRLILAMIVTISTSMVLVAIEKESVLLLIFFYITSFLEIVIIALQIFNNHAAASLLNSERIIFGILTTISLIILNINTILCQKNFNKKFNILLNYEIEMPKEFDYNYDPKQDDESEEEFESEEESFITRYIKYAKKKYHQYKKEISNFLE